MKQPYEEMLEELELKLREISQSDNTRLTKCTNKVRFCQRLVLKFRDHYRNVEFESKQEEINFFRRVKPRFMSEFYYQMEVFKFLKTLPNGSSKSKKEYINKRLDKSSIFLKRHCDFHSYIKMNYTHFDEVYFLRQEFDPVIHGRLEFPSDSDFSSPADPTLSCVLSNDRFIQFLKEELHNLENTNRTGDPVGPTWDLTTRLEWNKSKTDLVELIYSLYATNSIDGELKDLIHMMERIFKVDLGNFYRTYTDIKYKKNPTSFLDDLKTSLLEKIREENRKK